jgi:hypothetical protein
MAKDKLVIQAPSSDTRDIIYYGDTLTQTRNFIPNNEYGIRYDISYAGTIPQGLPIGIYSIDNGNNWYDMARSSDPLNAVILSTAQNTIYGIYGTGSSNPAGVSPFTILLKAALLSYNGTEVLQQRITGAKLLAYESNAQSYPRIAVNTEVPNPGGNNTVTVAHNLGYIPDFRVWVRDIGNRIYPVSYAGSTGNGVRADTSNIYIGTVSTSGWSTGTFGAMTPSSYIVRVYYND